jgi:hypothetical protein
VIYGMDVPQLPSSGRSHPLHLPAVHAHALASVMLHSCPSEAHRCMTVCCNVRSECCSGHGSMWLLFMTADQDDAAGTSCCVTQWTPLSGDIELK